MRAVDIFIENKGLHDVNPLLAGEEVCKSGHAFGPAIRECFLLHYVFNGKGIYTVGDRRTEVTREQMFIIRPYEMTHYQADRKDPWHYCWIGFDGNLTLGEWARQDVLDIPACEHIFRAICACAHSGAHKEYFLCAKLYELLAHLEQPAVPARARSYEYVMKAKNYIESNYANPIAVAELAASLNLNRSYFTACFKHYLGKSPQQYIVEFRLQKAAELLCLHSLSPTEAALSCGYPDLFSFSKMFKRHYGVAPTIYARRMRVE